MFLVKRVVADHGCVRRQPRAVEGRRHKTRQAHKLGDMIVKVRNTKKERPPTPADAIKTAATQSGEVVSYIAAWWALQHESGAQLRVERKNFLAPMKFTQSGL
jgi:hypothetical protein